METVEIHLRKKTIAAFMAFVVLGMIVTTVYLFGKGIENIWMKLFYIGMNVYMIYSFAKLAKRLKSNRPVLAISNESIIIINEKGIEQSLNWRDIQDVSVNTEDSTSYLTFQTTLGEKKVSISWLDKSSKEIKSIIDEYRSHAAANSA